MSLQSKQEWQNDKLLITPILLSMVLDIFVLHPPFKRPFFLGKNSNLFYFLRSCFTKRCKSVLSFHNNATRFHYKIQRRSKICYIFSHLGYKKHCDMVT